MLTVFFYTYRFMNIFTSDKVEMLKSKLAESKNIVITAHKSPDGDSIGSSTGLFHFLKNRGHQVIICHPDVAPSFLHWIPGQPEIELLESQPTKVTELIEKADILFCLDYNHPNRTGKMEEHLVKSNAFKVIVDHHRDPDIEFASLLFSDIQASSTCQLIFDLIVALGEQKLIDQTVASCLYTGLVTDTGSFRFSSTTSVTHQTVASLMSTGFNASKVHENLFDANSLNKLKLTSYALLEKLHIFHEYSTAYVWLTQEEEDRFKAIKGDTEGLVNQILSIEGVKMSVFFKETEQIIKISMRSKGKIPVNDFCRLHFEGGGHLNASGGKFQGKIEEAIKTFVTILPNFVEQNKTCFIEA